MITKNDIVLSAYEELRISGLTTNPNPSEIVIAIKRLDSMILGWQNKGLCLSYARSEGYNTIDPNQDSALNDTSAHAVVLNLAKSLAPAYGKSLHPDTRADARAAYLGLFSPDMTYKETDPYQPRGSGNSFGYGYDQRFRFQEIEENTPENCSTMDIKVGETDFFPIDFNQYLSEIGGDTIASYEIEDGQGVSVTNSSESDGVINIEANGLTEGFAPIKITVTTSSARINPETINFNVVKN